MASSGRTYSIKFQSEGLQALVKDLKSAASAFDETLFASQKSVDKSLRDRSQQVVQEAVVNARKASSVGASSSAQSGGAFRTPFQQTYNSSFNSERNFSLNLFARLEQRDRALIEEWKIEYRNFFTRFASTFPKVVAFQNENSVIPRLAVYNSPLKSEQPSRPVDPLTKLESRDRVLIEAWRGEYRNFFSEFKDELKGELKQAVAPNDGLSLAGKIISTPFQMVGDIIKFPFEATLLGVFSGFGEKLTADFSKGFKTRFEKGLGLELQSIGEDIGDIVGQSVYRSYEAATKAARNMILSRSSDKTPQIEELIEDLRKVLLGTLVQSAVVPLKAHKRIQMTKKALPQVINETGQLLINQQPTALEVEQIQKQKSITLLVGGVNNDPLANNTEYATRLLKPLLGDSHVVGIKNFWSNSKIGPEFKNFAVSLIRNIFSDETLSKGAVDYLKNQGFDKTLNLDNFKGFSLEDQNKFIEDIIDFFESGQLPFGRLLESAYQGYNPDDVMVAAHALYYKQLFPDKPLNIIGTSGGGFNAAGAIEILNKLGYQDIKGVGITTPLTGLEFTGNPDDFYGSIGTRDPYYQMLYGSALKGFIEPPGFMQTIPGAGMGHLLASYVGTPEFQNFFQWFFRGRIKVPKGMSGDAMNYVSRRQQNPEDENLKRTLLSAFGAPVEGYTFNSNDLAGLTAEIKKKAARIKDKDIKAEAQVFIDFLDTLIEELKIIEVLGSQFKPYRSLEKATEVYPELELFAEFNQPESSDQVLRSAVKNQLEIQKIFINFKTKIKAEADNIKRTLQSMRGEKVEGYAFYSPAEYETRAGQLGGLIGHLEKDLLKGATPKQKAQAYKYLSFLKRLQAQILEIGKGGAVDPQLEKEGQELFGFSLEGKAPAPTKEQRRAKIPKSPKQLAAEYSAYLQKLKTATVEGFGDTADLPQTIKAIKQQLKEYRKAIADGQIEIAKNLGESLLEIISAVKEVAASEGVNPQTIGTLSRYQNEILFGDKGRGRAQIGLTQLAESDPDFQKLQSFINPGNQKMSMLMGIDITQARKQINEIANLLLNLLPEGKTKQILSKPVLEALAEILNLTSKTVKQVQKEAREGFDEIFNTEGVNSNVDNFFAEAFQGIGKFFEGLEQQFPIITRLKGVIASVGVSLLAAFGIFTSGDAIIRLGQQALETSRKFEQLDRVIVSASGSAEKGAANLKFVASEARRLSLDLEVAKASYGKLLASAQGTALEGEAINQIFSAFGEAALNKGLNREKQDRMFVAIEQSISKGKIGSEELRQQLGDALPGTLQTASRALGLTVQQIDKMLQPGGSELVATDFWAKFAAQLSAENAGGVVGAADSAQASLTRFNNSVSEFQRAVGDELKPAEKLGLNTLSTILEVLRTKAGELIKALLTLVLVLAWQLITKLIASKAAAEGLGLGFTAIKNAIVSALPAITAFLSKFIAMTVAIETWLNVYRLSQDSFKNIANYAKESAKGLDNLARAYREAGLAAKELPAPPKRPEDLNSNKGSEFFGMRWNFDTVFRNPTNPIIKALTFSPLRSLLLAPFGGGKTTQGEREYNDFIVNASDLMIGANRNISESFNAKEVIAQIQEIDRQLETVRSRRFDLLPGDRTGLAQSIEQEQALLKEREKLLKITSTISTNFARDSENIKKTLEAIERLPEGANTEAIRAQLESTLSALSQSQSAFDELISSVGRSISESDRRLRNLTEGMSEFNDSLQIMATLARARVIREGVNRGLTRSQIDRYTQEVSVRENQLQLSQLQKAIIQIQQDLKNPIHAQSLQNLGIDPETVGSAQLERMLGEGRSAQEQSTLRTVQKLKQLQQEAANAEYQMAQAQQALVDAQNNYFLQLFNFWLQLKRQFEDLAIQTSDTLEEIRRQFVSVVQSIKQTQNQTAFSSLKAILTQPLVTQAERLINATNDAFEQYLNSLTQEIEQAFSRAALDLNLEQQLEQIGNAITDANRQQRDRVRNSTRQGEDTTRQWWDIRRQSPFAPGKSGTPASPSGVTTSPSGTPTSPGGTVTSPGGAFSPLGEVQGINGETVLNPQIPESTIRQSEGNISNDVGLLPANIQQANDAAQQATQQQIEALEGQRRAVEQLTEAQRALADYEARMTANTRRNNLIRHLQETGYAVENLTRQTSDLEDKYSETTPLRQHEAAMRSIDSEYLSLGRQTRNQLNTLTQQRDRFEELAQILREKGVPGLRAYQQQLLQSGNITAAQEFEQIINTVSEDATFLERQLPEIKGLIDTYQQQLERLGDVYKTAQNRQNLLSYFNLRSFELEKDKSINQVNNQLIEAQSNLLGSFYGRKTDAAILEREKALSEAGDRYQQQKLDLSRDIALNPSKYSSEEIQQLEAAIEQWLNATTETIKRQFQVRIDFDQREFNLQRSRSINDIGSTVLGSQSQFYQNRGDEFTANELSQRQAEIQERDRASQQLFDLEKDAALNPTKYTPEELAYLKAKLSEINSLNLQNIDKQFKDLGETIASVSEGALEDFFSSIFTNTRSIGEAFRDMALTILRSIAQIAAKQVVLSILGKGGGAFAQLFGLIKSGTPAYATGGAVEGAGTGTSDSILARLSNGEFVMRASAVRYWGEDFLADLNGMRSPRLAFAEPTPNRAGNSRTSTPTVIMNVTTPDANSFRRSEAQIGREAGELYRRSLMRNS